MKIQSGYARAISVKVFQGRIDENERMSEK
jgi:hypothetical protein